MIRLRPDLLRRIVAYLLSALLNAAVVLGLAELDAPKATDDAHEPHAVRPSIIELEPPEAGEAPPEPSRSALGPPALPAPPRAPDLELPDGPELAEGLGLELSPLDGLGDPSAYFDEKAAPDAEAGPPDQPPRLSFPPDLGRHYPPEAQRRGLSGRTILSLVVDRSGRVERAEVLRAEPPGVFDQAALAAARSLRFEPALKRGEPVSAKTRLELEWKASSSY